MTALLRGRYEPVEVVGAGGQGRVVKALDHLHDRAVALKIRAVRSEADRGALLSEARILFGLPPNAHLPIAREDFFDGDDYVIVMDWVEGTDLARILHTEGRPGLPPTTVLQWLADAAAALTHLHTQDPPVIHGDIKPANLVLTTGGRVALVDFGASSTAIAPGRRGGTPGYAAPERATSGELTRAADIYSLAATAFALLTGGAPTGIRPSWEGVDPALVQQLEAAIREGLATDPARRPATPGGLVERLRAGWASSLPTGVLTFCFTDIVGSTSLWEAHPTLMPQALVAHDRAIAGAVERHGGHLIDAMAEGDSTVSVFSSPTDAVAAAVDLTRDLAAVTWPGDLAIRARAAVHTGEATQRDGAYYGLTLNTGARLRGLADGGQVFVSNDTARLVRDHLPAGASLVDLGPARLRGLSEREQVFAVAAPGVAAPPPGTECPYPGLIAFGPEDASRYFGRDDVVDDLIGRLERHPFVAIIGPSGSGKSSVLRAGVGPRWAAGADVITPGPAAAVDGIATDTSRLLLVDQLEELFTQVDESERRARFLDALFALRRPIALALRADFYGSCASHRELAAEVAGHHVLLGPMSPEELRAAIAEPAAGAGLRLERGLVELLVSEVEGEPGALPLLAHALRATWEERDSRTLTLDAYRATGGVTGAIGSTADHVLAGFDDTDRDIAQHLLLRLVEPGDGVDDTRRRATLTELRPAGERGTRVDAVVTALAAARLVAIDEGTVQVAHEALIRAWPQLRTWLADQRDDLRVQRRVTMAAEAWATGGREPTELYRGPRLAAALEWLERRPGVASAAEDDFLRESGAEEQRVERAQARANRRLRAALVGVGVALVLAVIGGAIAVARGRDAAESRDHADVARLAAVSRSLTDRQPDVGLLLAVEAFRRADRAETRSTLLSALEAHPLLEGLIYGADSGLEAAAFSPDGALLATSSADGSGTALWSVSTRQRVATLRAGTALALDAAISPDGRWLAVPTVSESPSGEPASHLQVWDLPGQRLAHDIDSPAGTLTTAAFSADGRTLITQGGAYFDAPAHLVAVVWDTTTWQPRGEPWQLSDGYLDDGVVFVSGDGETLATPDDGAHGATVWDVATRTPRAHIATDDGAITALALSSDGAILAMGVETGSVLLVDSANGSALAELVAERDVSPSSIEFSHDDAVIAVANTGGRTQLFDVASGLALGPSLAANSAAVRDVSFSPDGTHLATAGSDRTGALWRLDGSRAIGTSHADHEAVTTEVVVSPDGRYVVSSGGDGTVAVRDIVGGSVRSAARGGEVLSVDVDASGGRVVTGDTSGTVEVAALSDLKTQQTRTFDDAWVKATAFNPETGVVAIAVENHPGEESVARGDEGFVALWDPERDRETAPRIVESGGAPIALAWNADGTLLASSTDNNVLRFYKTGATYEQMGDDLTIEDDTMTAVDISPDGRTIAAGTSSGVVYQYDIATHETVGPALRGHTFEVGGVAYSPDGSTLASTTVGLSTSRLWDARTGSPIGDELVAGRTPFTERTFGIDHSYPSRPAFASDGHTLFAPVVDGSVVAWNLRPSSWMRAACRIAGRDLSQAEWRQYLPGAKYRKTCAGL